MSATLLRCPYCHASVEPAREPWLACAGCLARHHRECFTTHGACGTCGERASVGPAPRRRRASLALAGVAGLALGLAAGPVREAASWLVHASEPVADGDWLEQAREARARGDLSRALVLLDRAVAADPNNELVWRSRGLLRLERGEPALALVDLTRATERDSRSVMAWAGLGVARADVGIGLEQAVRDLTRALELDPACRWARERRAELRQCLGDTKGARADLEWLARDSIERQLRGC